MSRFKEYLEEAETLAEEHWTFLKRWFEQIFKDGFVHGFKHALEKYESRERHDSGN